MNSRTITRLAAGACVLSGFWLPSLWLPQSKNKTRPLTLLAPPEAAPAASPGARSRMAALQAVVAGTLEKESLPDFPEAEALAHCLAGEARGLQAQDAASFLKSLQTEQEGSVRTAALQAWADAHPDAAMAALLGPDAVRIDGAESVIKTLAERNPDKSLAMLKSAPAGREQQAAWRAVFTGCAMNGPDIASAAIRAAPARVGFTEVQQMAAVLAARDPRAALTWCESLDAKFHDSATESVFEAWALTDPATGFRDWLRTGHETITYYGVGKVLADAWADRDAEGLFRWACDNSQAAGGAVALAAITVAAAHPQRALEMVAAVPADDQRRVIRNIGEAWVQRDAPAALAWARSLPADDRPFVLDGMTAHLKPADALAIAAELGTGTPPGFRALLAADAAAAFAKFPSLPRELQQAVYSNVTERADLNGGLAATAAIVMASSVSAASAPPPPEGTVTFGGPWDGVADVTTRWAAQDPVAAAAWVSQLPPNEARAVAAANTVAVWAHYDLPAARAWTEQLPPGDAHDKAAAQITRIENFSAPPPDHP